MIKYILSHTNVAINYFGFSIVWICCVYSGAQGEIALALIPTIIFLYLHFMIVKGRNPINLNSNFNGGNCRF